MVPLEMSAFQDSKARRVIVPWVLEDLQVTRETEVYQEDGESQVYTKALLLPKTYFHISFTPLKQSIHHCFSAINPYRFSSCNCRIAW